MTQGAKGRCSLPPASVIWFAIHSAVLFHRRRPIQSLLSQRTAKSGCLSLCKRANGARELKTLFPMLQIRIYDVAAKTRTEVTA
jgi:hypothetical protein